MALASVKTTEKNHINIIFIVAFIAFLFSLFTDRFSFPIVPGGQR